MLVSVIIPVYNEENNIEACLESLSRQSYKNLEIIIINDGSSDNSELKISAFAKASADKQNLKILRQDHKGTGAARNLGAKSAKGGILVFVDADMTFEKDYIENLVTPIVKGETKGTLSKEEYVGNWDNVWARCWNINEGWEPKRRHPSGRKNVLEVFYDFLAYALPHLDFSLVNYAIFRKNLGKEVFRAILKSEFTKVEGYQAGGYADDWSLREKLGYNPSLTRAKFYHNNPENLGEIYNQAVWVGKREYKLGLIGFVYALLRASIPVSVVVGMWRSMLNGQPLYLVFKIVYDFGVFVGILKYFISGRGEK